LYLTKYPKTKCRFILWNILDGQEFELIPNYENLKKMMEILVHYKFFNKNELCDDEEFIKQCNDLIKN
jgi:hypothetical protein